MVLSNFFNGPHALVESELRRLVDISANSDLIDKEVIAANNKKFSVMKYYGAVKSEESGETVLAEVASKDYYNASSSDEAAYNKHLSEAVDATTVAVIPVVGVMQKSYSWWYETANVDKIRMMIKDAATDPTVAGIVLYANTGGGRIGGVQELANDVQKARGIKPVITAVSDLWASAGVWALSPATEIYALSSISIIGSAGVMRTHIDRSKQYEEAGLTITHITSEGSEKKVEDRDNKPLSADAKARTVAHLTSLNNEFKATVARGRGDRLKKEDKIFEATVFAPAVAKRYGLIDGVMPFDKVIQRVTKLAAEKSSSGTGRSANFNQNGNLEMDKSNNIFEARYGQQFTGDVTISASTAQKMQDDLKAFDELKAEVETLKEEAGKVEDLNAKVTALEAEKADLTSQIEAKEAGEKVLNDKITELEAKLEAAGKVEETVEKTEKVEATTEETTVEASLEEAPKGDMASVLARLDALEKANAELSKENDELLEKVNEKEDEEASTDADEVIDEAQKDADPNAKPERMMDAAVWRANARELF